MSIDSEDREETTFPGTYMILHAEESSSWDDTPPPRRVFNALYNRLDPQPSPKVHCSEGLQIITKRQRTRYPKSDGDTISRGPHDSGLGLDKDSPGKLLEPGYRLRMTASQPPGKRDPPVNREGMELPSLQAKTNIHSHPHSICTRGRTTPNPMLAGGLKPTGSNP